MFGAAAASSREFGLWSLVVCVLSVVGIAVSTPDDAATIKANSLASRDLWFSECLAEARKIDDCARALDASYTLRDVYLKRVEQENK